MSVKDQTCALVSAYPRLLSSLEALLDDSVS